MTLPVVCFLAKKLVLLRIGLLVQYDHAMLYNQIKYVSALVDFDRALDKIEDTATTIERGSSCIIVVFPPFVARPTNGNSFLQLWICTRSVTRIARSGTRTI
jgi:hypothetical protein